MEFFYYDQEGVEVDIPAPNFEYDPNEISINYDSALFIKIIDWFEGLRKQHPDCDILYGRIHYKGNIIPAKRLTQERDENTAAARYCNCRLEGVIPDDHSHEWYRLHDQWRYLKAE